MTVGGTAAPANLQAGANSDFTINVNFGPPARTSRTSSSAFRPARSATRRPPRSAPVAQLNSATPGNDGCPANTQVGTVVANATIDGHRRPGPPHT